VPLRGKQKSAFCLLLLLGLLSGCHEKDIRTVYGMRSGYGVKSVNGTSVFGQMLDDAGHRVRSWQLLSPSLEAADVIVWFPDESGPPSPDVVAWFDDWLQYSYGDKTLIYVGRAYDAEKLYWARTQALAPARLKGQYSQKLAQAPRESLAGRNKPTAGDAEGWFSISLPKRAKRVAKLGGPWSKGIDAKKTTIEHSQVISPEEGFGILLDDGSGHPLVSKWTYEADEVEWTENDSRLIVIENGSFLLNAALVNHENRKLAGRLIAELGEGGKKVVFLESNANPTISDTDPSNSPPTGLELFRIWPIGAVLAQVAALGLVFALARFPIFGVPRRLERPSLTDFGKHVAALGRLLAATRDRAYADGLLKKYFTETKQD
jgi:hypothetical protein